MDTFLEPASPEQSVLPWSTPPRPRKSGLCLFMRSEGDQRGLSGPRGPNPSLHSCSVFLLDQNELVAKVFDGGVVDDEVRGCGGSMWP